MAIIDRGDTGSARGQPPGKKGRDVRDLLNHPLVRVWAIRAGVALVVGVLFAIVFDLRVGLTLAVVAVIADTVYKARSAPRGERGYPVSPAERRTEKELRGLAKGGWTVLPARAVPKDEAGVSDGKIDHLVIGPGGVFAIDSDSFDKRLPIRTLSHTRLFHGPFEQNNLLDEARWEANQARRLLGKAMGAEIPVQAVIAIYGPAVPWRWMSVRHVDILAGGTVRTYLRKRPKTLTEDDVARISEAARRVFPSKFD